MATLKIQDSLPPISKEDAMSYGVRNGIYIPESLAIHLSCHNGGRFYTSACINYEGNGCAGVDLILGITAYYNHLSIKSKWERSLDGHSELTPIAIDEGGHPFVLWRKFPERVFYFDKDQRRPTSEVSFSIVRFMDAIVIPQIVKEEILTWPIYQSAVELCNESIMAKLIDSCGGTDAYFDEAPLLYWAGLFGNPFSIRWLLDKGADANKITALGESPLHAAADSRSVDCCRLLVEGGANLEAVDREGRTPLLRAIVGQNIRNAECLLEHGAEFNVRDGLDRGAVEHANQTGWAKEFLQMFTRVSARSK